MARVHLGFEVAFVSELTKQHRIFRYVDAAEGFLPFTAGDSDPVDQSYCQRVVDGRLPELMTDARDHPEACTLAVTTALPVGAHLSVPIRFNGEVFGTFCCFSRTPNPALDARDLNMMRLYADFVGRLLQRSVHDHRLTEQRRERIRAVLDQGLYSLVYQPIVHVVQNQLVGHEALTRFHPEPYRSPDQWFHEAAEVGLLAELELAVIRRALADLGRFPEGTYLSLNISPQTLSTGAIHEVLDGVPLERVMLEVTEHASVADYGVIADQLTSLRQRGLRLAVDDAGAGYASFRHIIKLKPDVIKLDASLVAAIDQDPVIHALAAALIRFAEETGSKVVAEGVERPQELHVLRQLKVNKAQGYLLGAPVPIEHIRSTPNRGPDRLLRQPLQCSVIGQLLVFSRTGARLGSYGAGVVPHSAAAMALAWRAIGSMKRLASPSTVMQSPRA